MRIVKFGFEKPKSYTHREKRSGICWNAAAYGKFSSLSLDNALLVGIEA